MKCHLVYSVPFTQNMVGGRIERRFRKMFHDLNMPIGLLKNRQPRNTDLCDWPVKSPFENTRNLYLSLNRKIPTLLYHLTERVPCRFSSDDIFLGHPFFPHLDGQYGVTEMASKEKTRPWKFALITPLHCDVSIATTHIDRSFLKDVGELFPVADVLFAIMGEYWWNQWDESPFRHWKAKMIRLDMAVEVLHYPRVKHRFNPPGQRGYLYIGTSDHRKGSDFLGQLMGFLGAYPRGWIGYGPDIPNVPRISPDRALAPEFMAEIAEQFDFFVSPSRADPNPTTILESMAWGFPVVCTPQSGYYETPYRRNIYLDDLERSISVLEELQYADEADLLRMANEARQVVETQYTWDRFTSTVIQHLGL